tara:strand:+ start:3268 stop:4095 length:828 start_codon:yes stop_codon:yes gene_type:complete
MKLRKIYQVIYYQFLKRHYYGLTSSSRVLPNFLIIGCVRCGTTSLYYDICQHPSVEKAAYDEVGFFDDNFHLGLNWYRSIFPTKKKMEEIRNDTGFSITGEDTPFYIWNDDAVKRIAQLLPKIKLIVILRNPIDRAYSNYYLGVREGTEKRSFKDAIMMDMDYINQQKLENIDYKKSYIAKGLYSEQLKKWFKVFNKKQICIVSTEKFLENPNEILEKIFKFLELPCFSINKFEKRKASSYPQMDENIRKKLNDYFITHNEELYEMIGEKYDWNN